MIDASIDTAADIDALETTGPVVDERAATRRGLMAHLSKRVQNDESGIALVWMAMFLLVLLGFAGLAVDIGHGYMVAQRAQNAADAAALAGTIYLPGDVTTAVSTAQSVSAANGFTNGANCASGPVNCVTVSAVQLTTISRLKVTVTQNVPTWFARVLGYTTMNVRRSATADYRPPVEMGSPSSQYGNNPESSGTFGSTSYPNFWANVAGPSSPKANGDAYQAGGCDSTVDSCSTPPSDTSCGYGGTNFDYSCSGYYYAVHLPTAVSALKLQSFDAGFVAVGDSCGANDDGSNLAGAATLTAAAVQGWPGGSVAPSVRYAPVGNPNDPNDPGQRYCTGDHNFASDPNITTTYTVTGPAAVPGDPSTAPVTPICTKSYPGFQGDLQAQLQSATKMAVVVNGVSSPEFLGQYFRQWDNLCPNAGTFSASAGDYFIQVRTNLTTTGAPTSAGDGHNRFALQALGGSNIGIYGNGKMGIYANVGGGVSTSFYLARLLPGDAGHVLTIALFDIGDGSNSSTPGTLTIVPPSDATVSGSPVVLNGCTMQLGVGATFQNTNGTTPCQISGVTTDAYHNRWLTVAVPIPSGYTCDVTNPLNCWFRINYQFSGYIDDTTSWTASLGGDPVRIVQ